MKAKVLIVDDDAGVRELLVTVLEDYYDVTQADTAAALQKFFPQDPPDVVLLDVLLPDANGMDLLPQIKKNWLDTEVILLSGHGTITMAVEAGKRGAYNFLSKPFETEKLLADVKCALERKEQSAENTTLRRALETMSGAASPIFRSQAMQQVVRTVERQSDPEPGEGVQRMDIPEFADSGSPGTPVDNPRGERHARADERPG